jgi:hypothetical protein
MSPHPRRARPPYSPRPAAPAPSPLWPSSPYSFEANQGQADAAITLSRAPGPQAGFFFTPAAVLVAVPQAASATGAGGHTAAPLAAAPGAPHLGRRPPPPRSPPSGPWPGASTTCWATTRARWHNRHSPPTRAITYPGPLPRHSPLALRWAARRRAQGHLHPRAGGRTPRAMRWSYRGRGLPAPGRRRHAVRHRWATAELREAAPLAWQDGPAGRRAGRRRLHPGRRLCRVGLALGAYDARPAPRPSTRSSWSTPPTSAAAAPIGRRASPWTAAARPTSSATTAGHLTSPPPTPCQPT